jgi:hypothetical protein
VEREAAGRGDKVRISYLVKRIAYRVLRKRRKDLAEGKWGRNLGKCGGLGKGGIRLRRDELGLIGFVLDNVRCSLFVVLWHKPLFLLYLCLYCPF